MHVEWVRSLRDQCVAAGVPFFLKQRGEWLDADEFARIKGFEQLAPLTWDQAYGISGGKRCEHQSDGTTLIHVGRKAAGRMLHGRTWDDYPAVSGVTERG
jgi:protein gp37